MEKKGVKNSYPSSSDASKGRPEKRVEGFDMEVHPCVCSCRAIKTFVESRGVI